MQYIYVKDEHHVYIIGSLIWLEFLPLINWQCLKAFDIMYSDHKGPSN